MTVEFDTHLIAPAGAALVELGDMLDLELDLNQHGGCYFDHTSGWRVAIMLAGEDQIVVAVSLMEGTAPEPALLAEVLTQYNWLGGDLGGATLTFNPTAGSFVIWRSMDVESATGGSLHKNLSRILSVAEHVEHRLQTALHKNDNGADSQGKAAEIGALSRV